MATLANVVKVLLCGTALCAVAGAAADDDELPELEFLEYLGLWEESDEDWLALDGRVADEDKRSDSTPEGEESPETDDDS